MIGFSRGGGCEKLCGGTMETLLERLAASTGVDQATAGKAVGIILEFLLEEGPADRVQALIDRLPGAAALVEAAQADAGSGGMGGLMGAANRLMAAGLSMGQVQSFTRDFVAQAREIAGEDAVGEIVGAIPGLSQFV